ncbi:hypothetical protein V8E53_006762 [Lactarius tabidus]
MSKYRVASYITPAGNPVGDFLDDLTNPKIGGWPRSQDVSSIIGIAVYTGDIVDAVEVTYKVKGSATPVTVRHGGKGGKETLKFELNDAQQFVALYGKTLVKPSPYGNNNIVSLTFIVGDTSGDAITAKVYTTSGKYQGDTALFELNVGIAGANSYTFQPPGAPISYLQAFGYTVDMGPDTS